MRILVLNGSPRPHGNTAEMVAVFKESAEEAGHEVTVIDICKKNIKGCLACEYCHGKGQGKCVQHDDMQEIYVKLRNTNMLILASPNPGFADLLSWYQRTVEMCGRSVLFRALPQSAGYASEGCYVPEFRRSGYVCWGTFFL